MGRIAQLAAAALAVALVGCASDPLPSPQGEVPEVIIALKELNEAWLADCPELGDRPGSGVGDLLQDFADVSSIGAECRSRHQSLSDYIRPLVEKAKNYSPP